MEMTDKEKLYSVDKGWYRPCSNGWYALPRNNHACRLCGARLGEQCKAQNNNHAQEQH